MTPWRSRDSGERRAHRAARDVPLETSHFELDAQVRAEIDESYDDYVLIAGYLKGTLSAADGEYVEERLRIDSRFHALAEPLIRMWDLSLTGDPAEHDLAALTWNNFKGWIELEQQGTDIPPGYKRRPDRRRIARHPWPALPLDPQDFVQFLEAELGTDSAIALFYHAVSAVQASGTPDRWIVEVARGRDRGTVSTAVAHFLVWQFAEAAMTQLADADPVLSRLDAQIDRIEREYGLDEDETWRVGEGPPEWQALNDEWEAVHEQLVMLIFLRNGEREVAQAYSSHDERLYTVGRTLIFGGDVG